MDEVVARSALLERLRQKAPQVVDRPISSSRQVWIATRRPAHLPPRREPLEREAFVEPSTFTLLRASTKPFGVGLYSSTAVVGTLGMWWCYLRLQRGSTLFPKPWRAWSFVAQPGVKIIEVTSASSWVDFVKSAPLVHDGYVYPDWLKISRRWDAVHVTARAVAAIQGIGFTRGDETVLAPAYWDVESTLWLRWRFDEIQAECPVESY
ncbi:MAG: hypothetical protein ACYDCH_14930 [Gaiellaceae bacterium]